MLPTVLYLGGFLDQQLNLKQHIKEKEKKAMTNLIKSMQYEHISHYKHVLYLY